MAHAMQAERLGNASRLRSGGNRRLEQSLIPCINCLFLVLREDRER